jgi:hypothetical protein
LKFLVTTSRSFLLLEYPQMNQKVLHQGYGLYYGITYNQDFIYVAARKRMLTSSVDRSDEDGVILVFNKELCLHDEITSTAFPLRDIHQIEYDNGKLYVTCSFDNMIAIYDFKTTTWRQWFPIQEARGSDIHHFNSFLIEEESIFILAHNFGNSQIYQFSKDSLDYVGQKIELGRYAHNIWKSQGALFICSSGEASIKSDKGFVKKLDGFLRGVSISKEYLLVGSSEKVERKDRDMTDGSIFVLTHDYEIKEILSLKGEGMVLDIRVVDTFDYAIDRSFYLGE